MDESRMEAVRRRMTESLLSTGPWLGCFRYLVERRQAQVAPVEGSFGFIDKGFVTPEMSQLNFEEFSRIFAEAIRDLSARLVWRSLYARPKKKIPMDTSKSTERFWKRVVAEASGVGPMPVLVAACKPLARELSSAIYRSSGQALAGYDVRFEKNLRTEGGVGYQGTIEGIRVYRGPAIPADKAVLCSSEIMRTLGYGVVYGEDNLADFAFVDGDDLANSNVTLKIAQDIEWAELPIVEFDFDVPPRTTGSKKGPAA